MGSSDIQAKIKRGLAKAVSKTGSATSKKVYLVSKTNIGGNTPLDPPSIIETDVELINAIFKEYDQRMIGGSIIAGDRSLICDNDVYIKSGDVIKQGGTRYIVIEASKSAPTSDTLLYSLQVRVQ